MKIKRDFALILSRQQGAKKEVFSEKIQHNRTHEIQPQLTADGFLLHMKVLELL